MSGSIVLIGKFIPGGFIPEEDMSYFFVNIQLPDAASLQRSDVVAMQVETILGEHSDKIDFITTAAGFSLLSGAMTPNSGFIFVSTKDWDERDLTVTQLVYQLNQEFREKVKGAQVFAFGPPAIPGLGNGSGFTIMLQDKSGNTPAYLAEQTEKYMAEVRKRPEIGSIFTTFQANVPLSALVTVRNSAGPDYTNRYKSISFG